MDPTEAGVVVNIPDDAIHLWGWEEIGPQVWAAVERQMDKAILECLQDGQD